MSAQDPSGNHAGNHGAENQNSAGTEQNNDEMASKLSKELNNWRRRRSTGRARQVEITLNSKAQSEPARTIKVRGHETLVIRKARPIVKQKSDNSQP